MQLLNSNEFAIATTKTGRLVYKENWLVLFTQSNGQYSPYYAWVWCKVLRHVCDLY